ncbi:hypothetical protein [Natronococcus wangiae]|uniref:hypothetical protein n=1 Tax=Natronococcus wangiae TaxID=3068275 RepID=UPI00273FB787|nr:hypothetical protein [Natronococcus sp. AD5]
MTDQLHDRVNEVLNEADAESRSVLASDDGESREAERDLLEAADEASELLETADPRELLEALGLGTLPDGSEPDTLPEAIANGDPERVEELHRLLRLARLADRSDDEELEDAVGGLRETIDRAQTGEDDTMTDDTDQNETEQESTNGDGAADDLGERLRSAMSSSFEDFDDELTAMQDRIEDAASTVTDDEADEDAEDEASEADEGEEDGDDGLLGLGGEDGLGSSDSSRLSTMAPPPSERADMRAVKRHSTMPKKKD